MRRGEHHTVRSSTGSGSTGFCGVHSGGQSDDIVGMCSWLDCVCDIVHCCIPIDAASRVPLQGTISLSRSAVLRVARSSATTSGLVDSYCGGLVLCWRGTRCARVWEWRFSG